MQEPAREFPHHERLLAKRPGIHCQRHEVANTMRSRIALLPGFQITASNSAIRRSVSCRNDGRVIPEAKRAVPLCAHPAQPVGSTNFVLAGSAGLSLLDQGPDTIAQLADLGEESLVSVGCEAEDGLGAA